MDHLEVWMYENTERVDMPVTHRFTPGLYIREIFMPCAKTVGQIGEMLVTSKIHLKEHPFVISKGSCSVWTEDRGWVRYDAPYCGITKPLTRRVLWIHKDTIWTTFHVTNETSIEKIEREIIFSHQEHFGLSEKEMEAFRKYQHCSDSELVALEG
jgi:hypothetical protein